MLKQIRVWTGNCTIQRKTRKETRHAYVLVWRCKDTNLIMWSCLCDHQPGPACARKIQIETTLRAKDYPAQTIVFGGKRVVSTKKSAGKNHFSVCASDVMELLPVWRHNKLKTKKKEWASLLNLSFQERSFQNKNWCQLQSFSSHIYGHIHLYVLCDYYCASICVRSWCNWRATCVDYKLKRKKIFHGCVKDV